MVEELDILERWQRSIEHIEAEAEKLSHLLHLPLCEICRMRFANLLPVFIFIGGEAVAKCYLCNTCYASLKTLLKDIKEVEIWREGV